MAEAAIQSSARGRDALSGKTGSITRETGLLAVFIFSLSSIGLAYSGLLPFSAVAGIWPGSSLVGMLTVALVLALVHAYTYAVIGTIAPRYGADYVVASRVLGAPLAFASSWTLVIYLSMVGGIIATSIGQSTLPMFIQIISLITSDKALVDLSSAIITSQTGIVAIGTLSVVIVFLVLLLPPRVTRGFLAVGLLLALVAWSVICFQLVSGTAAFPTAWERFMGDGSFMKHLTDARSLGMQVNFGNGPVVMAGLVLGFWMFYGYFNGTHVAAEVKKPEKNLLLGSWLALVVGWAVLALTTFLLQRLVPLEWLSAESFLSRSLAFTGHAMPWLPLYAAVVQPNAMMIWIVGAAWIIALLNLVHTVLYTSSRIMIAWAEDGIIPESITFIHPVLKSPLISVLLVCLVAEAGVVLAALSGSVDSSIDPVFFMAGAQILPVLSVTLLPFLKRDWFNKAPAFARRKIGPLPVITLVGSISFIYLIWMIVTTMIFPTFARLNSLTLLVFGGIFGSGLIWFYGRRAFLKAQNVELNLQLKQIPEE